MLKPGLLIGLYELICLSKLAVDMNLQVTGQVFYRAAYYRTDKQMHPRQLPYKPDDRVDRKRYLTEASKEARGN